MSDSEIQELIDAILTSPEAPHKTEAIHTRDGQIATEMRQTALIQLINHPQQERRIQAAELLGESQQPAACEALLKLAHDDESEVRQTALSSLSAFADESVTDALIASLSDTDYVVRATAAEILGGRQADRAVEPLMNSLKDEVYMVRATAAEALGRMEAFMSAPALRDLLLDTDQWVRYSAAESLSQIESDEAIWPLLMNANSAEHSIRLEALAELAKLGDRRAIPSLVKMLTDAPDLDQAVLNTLEAFHDPLSVDALVELALFTEKPHLREQALLQSQQLSLKNTLEALASWLEPERPQYAQKAIEALHQLPTSETTPIFLYALQHPDTWVRTVALITLDNRHEPVPVDLLLPLLEDATHETTHDLARTAIKNLITHHAGQAAEAASRFAASDAVWQRLAVAENLSRLPEQDIDNTARALLGDVDSDVREAALKSLGIANLSTSLELLLSGSQDDDAWVRQAAIEGLARQNAVTASARLIEILQQDEDFLVRAAAAEALGQHRTPEVDLALVAALDDSKPSVRLQAVHGLFARELPPNLDLLERLLADGDKNVVLTTLQQLRNHQELRPKLDRLLSSDDIQIRSAAESLAR